MLKLSLIWLFALLASVFGAAKAAFLTYTAPASYTAAIPAYTYTGYVAPYASTYNAYTVAHTAAFPAAYSSAPVVAAAPAVYSATPYAPAPAVRYVAAPAVLRVLKKKK